MGGGASKKKAKVEPEDPDPIVPPAGDGAVSTVKIPATAAGPTADTGDDKPAAAAGGDSYAASIASIHPSHHAEAIAKVCDFLENLMEDHACCDATVAVLRAAGLANTDAPKGASDPYVVVKVAGQEQATEKKANTLAPAWSAPPMAFTKVTGQDTIRVEVWDKDDGEGNKNDDALGSVDIPINGQRMSAAMDKRGGSIFELTGEGATATSIVCLWFERAVPAVARPAAIDALAATVDGALALVPDGAQKDQAKSDLDALFKKCAALEGASVGVRREIRSLSEEEQKRFLDAFIHLQKLEVEDKKDETEGDLRSTAPNEFLRLAGYHGYPSNDGNGFCHHRTESFPGWHRAYLCDLEKQLQRADKALGNDGSLMMPYWDYGTPEVDGCVVPPLIRSKCGSGNDYLGDGDAKSFWGEFYDGSKLAQQPVKLRTDARVKQMLTKSKVKRKNEQCIRDNPEHWQHASTENRRGPAVESGHNSTHNALGWPLTNLGYAAFHPMFWLLHCNTDRVHESYLQTNQGKDSEDEFKQHQAQAASRGNKNAYEEKCVPFRHPKTNAPFTMHDAFDCKALGYTYDALVPVPPQQMREPPTFAFFPDVDVVRNMVDKDGNKKSFQLHVFLVPNEGADATHTALFDAPDDAKLAAADGNPFYAGLGTIFGGKGPLCANCNETKPVHVRVDVTETLNALGATRDDVTLKVVCQDESDACCMASMQTASDLIARRS